MTRKKMILRLLFLLCALALTTSAYPIWGGINSVDVAGNTCPAITSLNVKCPLLCVSGDPILHCPAAVSVFVLPEPSADNPCDCSQAQPSAYHPCSSGLRVNLTSYLQSNKTAVTQQACAQALAVDMGAYGDATGRPFFVSSCPAGVTKTWTYREPGWLGTWAGLGALIGLLVVWHWYKRFRERRYKSAPTHTSHANDSYSTSSKDTLKAQADSIELAPFKTSLDSNRSLVSSTDSVTPLDAAANIMDPRHGDAERLVVKGYVDDAFGTAVLGVVIAVSFGWMLCLAVITADYYGAFTGMPFGLFLGDATLSLQAFMGVFYGAAAWLLGVSVLRDRLRNYLRVRVPPSVAQYIQVEKHLDTIVMLDKDGSGMLRWLRRCEDRLTRAFGWDFSITTCRVHNTVTTTTTTPPTRYFVYRCTRHVFDPTHRSYEPYTFDLGQNLLAHVEGLTSAEAARRIELLGPNFIEVAVPSFPRAFAREVTGAFYLYQFIILWLFYYWNYFYIGLVDLGVILVSAIIKVSIRLRSERRIKRMAEHRALCRLLRDGTWREMSTAELVEGDIIEVVVGESVPVDAVLVTGDVVVDESSLTGEALPIRKFSVKPLTPTDEPSSHLAKTHTLFAGTAVSQTMPAPDSADGRVRALVLRTGTRTERGALVTRILFPSPVAFVFDEQLRVAFLMLAAEAVVMFCIAMWWQTRGGLAGWLYGMFCLCQVISPLIPASLVVGQSMGASALRRQGIYCVDLPRILLAAKTKVFCFDKTGTLTKEGLDFFGVIPVRMPGEERKWDGEIAPRFSEQMENVSQTDWIVRLGLGSCHTVTKLNNDLIGNQVDVQMFRATRWHLSPPTSPDYLDTLNPPDSTTSHIHVLKRFEFEHARQSMSVAVLDPRDGHIHVFVKGSFEKIKDLSDPASVPSDYDARATRLAREGCYTLAIAHADLGAMDPAVVRSWPRERFEHNLRLTALILFKNMLKEDTASAMRELREGDVRCVMITGDNAHTGIYIARGCGMIPSEDEGGRGRGRVVLGDVRHGTRRVVWMDEERGVEVDVEKLVEGRDGEGRVELAVTGKAFDILCEEGKMRRYLLDTRVFARMTPDQKVTCVKLHMERAITSMCGDGGNDCGALRAAHAGIALSEAEASIVSPFSTNVRSIWSCVRLLIEGRAALTTSFAGYKFLIMYGQTIQVMKVIALYYSLGLSQNNWILVDAFIAVLLSWSVTQAKATNKLAPYRPTARILGPETLASLVGMIIINWTFTLAGFKGLLYSQSFFRCHEWDASSANLANWWLLGDNYETQTIALLGLPQFVTAAAAFNFGYLYRQSWWRNYPLAVCVTVYLGIVYYFLLADPNAFGCLFRYNCGDPDVLVQLGYPRPTWYIEPYNNEDRHNVYPRYFRYVLFGYSLANIATCLLWEKVVVLGPVRNWARKKYPLQRTHVKL